MHFLKKFKIFCNFQIKDWNFIKVFKFKFCTKSQISAQRRTFSQNVAHSIKLILKVSTLNNLNSLIPNKKKY